MEQLELGWTNRRREITVGELTEQINELLFGTFADIWVSGEISGAKLAPSGHWYFTLKDADAQLACACFRQNAMRLRVKPKDGMQVLARGHIEVYPARGTYQLIVETIEVRGQGELLAAFEELRKRLHAEGLFDSARKRELPPYPRRIGIVTSPSGAVIRDLVHVLRRRTPHLAIRLYPAQVQGDGAAAQIVEGINYFSKSGWADVVIAGRGGGSIEDLWPFNEESVARAIANCSVPVVSAVGHETDFTIADFVADLRAATPSAAAEIVTEHWVKLEERLSVLSRMTERAMRLTLERRRSRFERQGVDRARMLLLLRMNRLSQRLDELDYRLRQTDVRQSLQRASLRLERFAERAVSMIERRIEQLGARLDRSAGSLAQLSPLAVLDRGYAIVQSASGSVIKSPPQSGAPLRIRVAEGEFPATAS